MKQVTVKEGKYINPLLMLNVYETIHVQFNNAGWYWRSPLARLHLGAVELLHEVNQ